MEKQNFVIDHYRVLDLPSGEEGSKLPEKQITKAYRAKALQLHPDKRPNDPYANAMFQRLNSSYAMLKDPKSRKQFDESFQKGLVLTKDQENILFGLGYLIFVAAPMAFPAVRNRRTKLSVVATVLCYHLVFEELHRRQKLEKLWYWMVRVGDYFKRNPRQAGVWLPIATGTSQEPKSPEYDYTSPIFNFLYWVAARVGDSLRSEDAYDELFELFDDDSCFW